MKSTFGILIVVLLSFSSCKGQTPLNDKSEMTYKSTDLIKDYRGEIKLPSALMATYTALVNTIDETKKDIKKTPFLVEKLKAFCLPNAIVIETGTSRQSEYGKNMNINYLVNDFHPKILNLRKDSDNSYLIRTGSSGMWFVETKTMGWKLYRYFDKPIQ